MLYKIHMANAVTEVKNKENKYPVKELTNKKLIPVKELTDKKFAYVNFGEDSGVTFFNQINKYTKVDWVIGSNLDDLIKKLENYDTVIIGFHKSNDNPWKAYKFTDKELVWI